MIAAALRGETKTAMIATVMAPTPPEKPLLEMPVSKTAKAANR